MDLPSGALIKFNNEVNHKYYKKNGVYFRDGTNDTTWGNKAQRDCYIEKKVTHAALSFGPIELEVEKVIVGGAAEPNFSYIYEGNVRLMFRDNPFAIHMDCYRVFDKQPNVTIEDMKTAFGRQNSIQILIPRKVYEELK